MQDPEPPPVVESQPPSWKFQFNTASLLGLMALVAVGCVLMLSVPWLFATGLIMLAASLLAAYTGFVVTGCVIAEGQTRLFTVAALVCLGISVVSGQVGVAIQRLIPDDALYFMVLPILHIVFSLFGGWIAIRSYTFWKR